MSEGLPALIDRFADLEVLVIGEAILDSYLEGSSERLCREAPVPIVNVTDRTDAAGGAANAAMNVRDLGARTSFLSVVGDDREGALLRSLLSARGIATDGLIVAPERRTLAKQRVVAASQLLVRFDTGSGEPLDARRERMLLDRLAEGYSRCQAVIVSDYGYGILTRRLIEGLAELQASDPRVLVVDSKRLPAYREVGVTAIKPNYAEAVQLLGLEPRTGPWVRVEQIAEQAGRLLDLTGAQIAAVTLDQDGALIVERGRPLHRTYARPASHSRAAGAGDTFLVTLALALAAGAHTPAAAEMAAAAAEVVVGKERTATCSGHELREWFSGSDKCQASPEALAARLEVYRQQGRRIVFTNGCFDILHRGHITYLNRAKALGDVLVVGVNGDESVRRLKGSGRPINSLEDRLQVLSALSCVDFLVAFQEDTPEAVIRAIRPDVFVKGGDYTLATLPEAPLVQALGGSVQIMPYLMDRSTTGIIERIRTAEARSGQAGGLTSEGSGR